jgi:hypothetical protein
MTRRQHSNKPQQTMMDDSHISNDINDSNDSNQSNDSDISNDSNDINESNNNVGAAAMLDIPAAYTRHVLDYFAAPHGQVYAHLPAFRHQLPVASVVKYICRHISHRLPPGLVRAEPCPARANIQQALHGMDLVMVPLPFSRMIGHLMADTTTLLPDELYEAAFAQELLPPFEFRRDNMHPHWGHGNAPHFVDVNVYRLLYGAGYNVWRTQLMPDY